MNNMFVVILNGEHGMLPHWNLSIMDTSTG